ncbi:hypothetical protein DRE_02089 [Drechslerella stenobrocha 248]|uniref:Uncharacterized protein n=1 Tax=Drechslerella stenobrocha 248 TaxID=1043628 RepID=W7IGJ7_9PEZI|nr:hypothetical protein DRE_02089 [Drechslerella stenobrocha 248]
MFTRTRLPLLALLLLQGRAQLAVAQGTEDSELFVMRLDPLIIPYLTARPAQLLEDFRMGSGNAGIYLKERVWNDNHPIGDLEMGPLPPNRNVYAEERLPDRMSASFDWGVEQADNEQDLETLDEIFADELELPRVTDQEPVSNDYYGFRRVEDPRNRNDVTLRGIEFTSGHRATTPIENGLPGLWMAGNPGLVQSMGGPLIFEQQADNTVAVSTPGWDIFACGFEPSPDNPNFNPLTDPPINWQIMPVQRAVWSQTKYPGINEGIIRCIPVRLVLETAIQAQEKAAAEFEARQVALALERERELEQGGPDVQPVNRVQRFYSYADLGNQAAAAAELGLDGDTWMQRYYSEGGFNFDVPGEAVEEFEFAPNVEQTTAEGSDPEEVEARVVDEELVPRKVQTG